MSRDIRSFFNVVPKNTNKAHEKITKKSKATVVIESDDEDIIQSTPQTKKTSVITKRKVQVLSSDSEDESHKKKKPAVVEEKMKPVSIDDVFGDKIIKQSKVEHVPKTVINKSVEQQKSKHRKKKVNTEIGVHADENFEKTLLELDDDLLLNNIDVLDKTIEDAGNKNEKVEKKESSSKENSPCKEKGEKRTKKHSSESTPKKPKLEHTDSGIDPDQEAFEKKRYSAMLYQKYKNRGGPKHHGQKEIPKGKPDCLANLTFLRTGVLDSLEGNEFENLVKEHGGKVVHAVSKKVNYLVVGEEPGPAKLDKARGLQIREISEDDLLDMILVRSGIKPKFSKNMSMESTESGFGTEEEHHKSQKKARTPDKKQKVVKESSHKEISKAKSNLKASSEISDKKDESKIDSNLEVKKKPTVKDSITVKKDFPHFEHKLTIIPDTELSWTEKYKPKSMSSIIGQQDTSSNMNKLKRWLENWHKNQQLEERKKIPRPSPWAKNDNGAYYKAALLSGPPGVGKTTTATLVSQELGYDVVEFNASDTRSKKLLHQEVSQLLSTKTIAGFAIGKKTTNQKRVLLMDEVDGMAGNEDRGGISELINLMKHTHIPIICMCNDRSHPKMRSLVNYCFDLKFTKPKVEQIKGAMMSICFKEGLKLAPNVLTEIINGTDCDIRQTLNNLSMWTAADKNLSFEVAKKEAHTAQKDTVLGSWEVVRKVFAESEQKEMSFSDKTTLFFFDYSLNPLFVQENYINVTPKCPSTEVLKRLALAADSISIGDLIGSKIRSSNNWALLESQSVFSLVLPGYYMSGHITKRINFPSWLGKNSSANKNKRMLAELQMHTRTRISGNKLAMRLDYLVPLRNAIINPLKKYGTDGVHHAIEVMKNYNMLREDLNNLVELCQWKDMKNPFNDIDAKTKSAFTRAYNKEAHLLPFAPDTGASKKKATKIDNEFLEEEEFLESDPENDDVGCDTMIKVKAKTENTSKKKAGGSSKTKDSTKGKGKPKKK